MILVSPNELTRVSTPAFATRTLFTKANAVANACTTLRRRPADDGVPLPLLAFPRGLTFFYLQQLRLYGVFLLQFKHSPFYFRVQLTVGHIINPHIYIVFDVDLLLEPGQPADCGHCVEKPLRVLSRPLAQLQFGRRGLHQVF